LVMGKLIENGDCEPLRIKLLDNTSFWAPRESVIPDRREELAGILRGKTAIDLELWRGHIQGAFSGIDAEEIACSLLGLAPEPKWEPRVGDKVNWNPSHPAMKALTIEKPLSGTIVQLLKIEGVEMAVVRWPGEWRKNQMPPVTCRPVSMLKIVKEEKLLPGRTLF